MATCFFGEGSLKLIIFSLTHNPVSIPYNFVPLQTNRKMGSESKTVSVTINYQTFDDSKLYRLQKSTVIRVVPGESLLGKHISIQTNYPSNDNEYIRNQFKSLEWFSRYGEKLSSNDNYAEIRDLEMYCQVKLQRSGTFRFYILEEDR